MEKLPRNLMRKLAWLCGELSVNGNHDYSVPDGSLVFLFAARQTEIRLKQTDTYRKVFTIRLFYDIIINVRR